MTERNPGIAAMADGGSSAVMMAGRRVGATGEGVKAAEIGDEVALPDRVTAVRFFNGSVHRLAGLGLVELSVIIAAFYGAIVLRFPEEGLRGLDGLDATPGSFWVRAMLIVGVTFASLASMGLYQLRQRARFTGVVARLLVALFISQATLGLIFYVFPSLFMGRGVLVMTGVLFLMGSAMARYAFLRLVDEDFLKRRVLIWGAGDRAATIANRLRRQVDRRGFNILGYISTPGDKAQVPAWQLLSLEDDLLSYVLRQKVDEVVVAMDDNRAGYPAAFLRECRLRGIVVCDVVNFLERETGRVSVELARPSWLIYSQGFRSDLVRLAIKRLFDIGVSLVVLFLSLPVALLAAIAIYLEDRGPIFYRQIRTGQNGRPFHIIKFRSMRVNAELDGQAVWAVRNDDRVTRVGAFIRKSRIDELPQVLNVLAGQMSFVGPRPERPGFVAELTMAIPFYYERHFVKPGITGWAQVRYPYGASVEDAREKLGYDLYYVANHSMVFDIMVILQTVEIVFFRVGSR